MNYRVLFALALGFGPTPGSAQSSVRTFLLLTGPDTVAVEEVNRTPGRLEGQLLFRGGNQRWHYIATLGPGQTVATFDNDFRLGSDAPGAPARQRARFTFQGDSVFVTFGAPGPPPQRIATKPGAMPFVNPSFALVEQAIRRRMLAGKDSLGMALFAVVAGQTLPVGMLRVGRDSMVVTLAGAPARLAIREDGTITGGVLTGQGPIIIIKVIEGAAGGSLVVARPDYSAPANAPYSAVAVSIPTPTGYRLAGTLTIPRGARGRVPAVVTITGSGSQDRDESILAVKGYRPFRDIADALGRRGIAVLRMDDRGFGESEGGPGTPTSRDFADDIRTALTFLRARPEIDGTRLGLIGHSEGGLIAPMVAATDPGIKGIVLLAGPAYTGRKILEFQNRYALARVTTLSPAQRDSVLRVALRTLDSLATTQPWMRFFLNYDPVSTARTVKTPVLILQGATDQQITADQAPLLAQAFRAGGNRDVTMRVYPATNHLFLADPDGNPAGYSSLKHTTLGPEVLRTVVDWVVRRLTR